MKTVLDAVNEFKGVAQGLCFIQYSNKLNHFIASSHEYLNSGYYRLCDEKEFNDLVSQMETNFGLSVSYTDWLTTRDEYGQPHGVTNNFISDAINRIKSDKESEVMDIDWSKAPEGATHYDISPDVYPWIKEDDNGNKFWHHNEWVNYVHPISESDCHVRKPQPKPIYTQAMCDNGYCPKLGAKFIVGNVSDDSRIIDFRALEVEVIGLSVTDRHKQVITFSHPTMGIGCGVFNESWVEPLTPPIELIDDGRYEFELCFGDYRLGYWKEERNSFFDSLLCANKICGKSEASNIQPLTVEVK